jgi:copper resistance protein B
MTMLRAAGLALVMLTPPVSDAAAQVRPEWAPPVHDRARHLFLAAERLEYRAGSGTDALGWDVVSWYGGDYSRVWLKSEGTLNADGPSGRAFDLQLLYGRFLWRYYDLQLGLRVQTRGGSGDDATRAQAVVGLEGLAPYNYDLEAALLVSDEGDVSAALSATKDLLITQRFILQPRVETTAAVQEVEEFGVGSGWNNLSVGFRVRYEIWRKFGPYAGVVFNWGLFGTRNLVRAGGGDPDDARFVAGVRVWR